jgi:type IV pilus assembly protein PilV
MRNYSRGFTMIEILVALLVFAVGVLGAGALQLANFNNNKSNFYRSQAIILAQEIIDQMRVNPNAARNGSQFDDINTDNLNVSNPDCQTSSDGCSPDDLAQMSLFNWQNNLLNSGVFPLEGTRGTISRDGNAFTVTISWDDQAWDGSTGRKATEESSYSVTVTL